jgi:hypothetical protein
VRNRPDFPYWVHFFAKLAHYADQGRVNRFQQGELKGVASKELAIPPFLAGPKYLRFKAEFISRRSWQ